MLWGGRWEGGSCLGTHVRIKDFKIKKKIKLLVITFDSEVKSSNRNVISICPVLFMQIEHLKISVITHKIVLSHSQSKSLLPCMLAIIFCET